MPSVDAGRFSLKTKSEETINDAAGLWNPSCYDVLDSPAGYIDLLRGTMGDAANTATNYAHCPAERCPPEASLCRNGTCVVPDCASIAHHCDEGSVAGTRARQLCPETCGCDAPRSPLVLSLPSSGCGDRCVRSGRYLDRRQQLPCEDLPPTDPDFAAFLRKWDAIRMDWPADWSWGSFNYIQGIRLSGCAFLRNNTAITEALGQMGQLGWPPFLFGINACVEDGVFFPVKPLSYFCPVACGCHAGDPHCPDSCPRRNETTAICPEEWRRTGVNIDWFSDGSCPLTPKNRF